MPNQVSARGCGCGLVPLHSLAVWFVHVCPVSDTLAFAELETECFYQFQTLAAQNSGHSFFKRHCHERCPTETSGSFFHEDLFFMGRSAFGRLGCNGLCEHSEATDCVGFSRIDAKNGQQSRQLQQVMELIPQIRQAQRCALFLGANVSGHQYPQSGAVDVRDIRHVQHNLLALANQTLYSLTKGITFLTKKDATRQSDDGDISDLLGGYI